MHIVAHAKYHGHCYQVQLDHSQAPKKAVSVTWIRALGEKDENYGLEHECGLGLVRSIVDCALQRLYTEREQLSSHSLRAALQQLEPDSHEQRVYWIARPDLSRLLHTLPDAAITRIVAELTKHDLLQLRGVCYAWKSADTRLWQTWVAVHQQFFPQHVASRCTNFAAHRRCQEAYVKGGSSHPNQDLHLSCFDHLGAQLSIDSEHIIERKLQVSSGFAGPLGRTELVMVSRHTAATVFKHSLTSEVRTWTGSSSYSSSSYEAWWLQDQFILGNDTEKGELTVFSRTSGEQLQRVQVPGKVLLDVAAVDGGIELLSLNKQRLRWDAQSGRIHCHTDYADVNDSEYASATRAEFCGKLVVFHDYKNSWVFSAAIGARGPQKLPCLKQLTPLGQSTVGLHYDTLHVYDEGPDGFLKQRWQREHVKAFHVAGEHVIANCSPYGGIHLLDLQSGESVRELAKTGCDSVTSFVDAGRLYVSCEPYQRETQLQVIDIAGGELLFQCSWPAHMHFLGAQGDRLYACGRNGGPLITFEA